MIGLTLEQIARAATGGLVTAVWQGAVLAAVVGLGLRMVPKAPAAVRFAIWFAAFGLVAVLPLAGLRSAGAGGGHSAWLTVDARWCFVVLGAWVMASAMRAVTLVWAVFRVRALWKGAVPLALDGTECVADELVASEAGAKAPLGYVADLRGLKAAATPVRLHPLGGAQEKWNELKSRSQGLKPGSILSDYLSALKCRPIEDGFIQCRPLKGGTSQVPGFETARRAELCVSDEVDRPTVIGFFAPRIVMPAWLVEKLTREELRQIVLHEAGHLDRADDWMNLLQKIALVVFPLNPALAWVERRLCFERELACDESVLRTTGAPKAYAECLARVAEHRLGRRGLTLALGALGRESELGRRVSKILRRGDGMKPMQAKLVLAGAMAVLVVAGVGFARLPQVVGFASATPSVAAVSSENIRVMPKSAMYHDVSFHVVERPVAVRALPVPAKVNVEKRVVATQDLIQRQDVAMPVSRSGGVARMVNLSAEVTPTLTDAPRPQMVQWVVVTEWIGADGSGYVLTSADGRVLRAQEVVAPVQEQVDADAVAVRDGWVVFEL